MTFAQWLKAQRLALDLTQQEMAHKLSMGRSAYLVLESGEREPTKIQEHGLRPLIAALIKKP